MFQIPTTFVLGAGGSWHYGYPTGEALVREVIVAAYDLVENIKNIRNQTDLPDILLCEIDGARDILTSKGPQELWGRLADACQDCAQRLKWTNPLVIDYFLKWNEDLRPIGKFLIAFVLLEKEFRWRRVTGEANWNRRAIYENSPIKYEREQSGSLDLTKYRDDWYRFILYHLMSGCDKSSDLIKNQVNFVTFNYDVSLEYCLMRGLRANRLFEAHDIDAFFDGSRILHVYGQLRNPSHVGDEIPDLQPFFQTSWSPRIGPNPDPDRYLQFKNVLDYVYASSKRIRTIGDVDKDQEEHTLTEARAAIRNCKQLHVLGYGFDEANSDRIGLTASNLPHQNIVVTNFNDSSIVNRRIIRRFLSQYPDQLNGGNVTVRREWAMSTRNPIDGILTKSVRNVYDALEFDFEL